MPSPPSLLLAAVLWLSILLGSAVLPGSNAAPTEKLILHRIHHDLFAPTPPQPRYPTLNMQERVPNDRYPQRGGDHSERLRKARRRKKDDPCSAHSFHPPTDPGRCRTSPSVVATREPQIQGTSSPFALQKRAVKAPSTLATTQPPPKLRVLPANHPQLIKPLSIPSVTRPKATKKRPHPKTHTPLTRPKSKESDPIVHAAAAAAIIPPPPDKALYPRLRNNKNNNSNNNNNNNSNNSNSNGAVELPPEEKLWLREEEQEADKTSPEVILIALGASIGGLSACFFCILGLGRALGCCYWRRQARDQKRSSLSSCSSPSLTSSSFSQAPSLAGGAGGGRLTAPALPRDGKWVIGGPQPLKDEEKEGEKECQFLVGFHGERGGPKSASPSIASTLVPKEEPVEGKGKYQPPPPPPQQQQQPRFTEFWHDSPSPSSPVPSSISILKPWKRIQRPQGSHPRIEIPSSARTMQITSPMDPLPPRRPLAPSEQQQQDAYEQNTLSPVSTTSGNMIGRSRRMPAHLPTPRAFKPQAPLQGQISQGNNFDDPQTSDSGHRRSQEGSCISSRGGYPREGDDENDDNDDGVEWLMMTSPPLAQALPSEPQQWHRDRDQGHYDNDETVHDFNNGWGDQFVSEGEGYFASTHPHPHPPVNPTSPAHHY